MIFSLWDLGGSPDARSFWRMYYQNTQAIIFVVDSSDLARMVRACNATGHAATLRGTPTHPRTLGAPCHRMRLGRICIE